MQAFKSSVKQLGPNLQGAVLGYLVTSFTHVSLEERGSLENMLNWFDTATPLLGAPNKTVEVGLVHPIWAT